MTLSLIPLISSFYYVFIAFIIPELDFDVPIDKFKLCDFNVDLGYDDHMFHMLGGNVENFEFLGSLCRYNAALDSYCIELVDMPRKSCGTLSLIFLLIFLWRFLW